MYTKFEEECCKRFPFDIDTIHHVFTFWNDNQRTEQTLSVATKLDFNPRYLLTLVSR